MPRFFFLTRNRYWIGIVAGTPDSNFYEDVKTWVDSMDNGLSKYGIFPYGPEAEEEHERIRALKVKYDPENVFHHNLNIDPKKGIQKD